MENIRDEEIEIDLREVYFALKKRLLIILAVALLFGCASCAYTKFFMEPVYTSSSRDGTESAKGRTKFKCPKISFAGGKPTCICENPCSDAKYGKTVHLVMADNPRLFNDPPRSSKEWKLEYNARTSAERCNKREKVDYKLENSRYRSSKMWYCCLFSIMMCQHLDAWDLPKTRRLKELFEQAA